MRWAWRDLPVVRAPRHRKRAIRIQHLGGTTPMREYRCDTREGWHIGHLPNAVKWGVRSRDEHYRRRLDE